jgi:hypothetical protein
MPEPNALLAHRDLAKWMISSTIDLKITLEKYWM